MFQLLMCAALAQTAAPANMEQSEGAAPRAEQELVSAPQEAAQPIVAPASIKLPALTGVELTVVDEVTSKTAVTGMPVQLRLSRPVYVTSELGIPAGTAVDGIVIHAAKGGMGGKSGELLIGARRIVVSDTISVPLRSFKLGPAKGRNNETLAFATAVTVGLPALFITGGSAKVPAGAIANAKTQADVELPIALLAKLPASEPPTVAPPPLTQVPEIPSNTTQGENK